MIKIAVLVSGSGSNLQALIDANLLLTTHQQIAIGKNVDHGDRDGAREIIVAGALPFAVKREIRGRVQIGAKKTFPRQTRKACYAKRVVARAPGIGVGFFAGRVEAEGMIHILVD